MKEEVGIAATVFGGIALMIAAVLIPIIFLESNRNASVVECSAKTQKPLECRAAMK